MNKIQSRLTEIFECFFKSLCVAGELLFFVSFSHVAAADVSVTNVRASQVPGTDTVEIFYDLDFPWNAVSVTLEIWDDFESVSSASASGHIGTGLTAKGINRRITWNAASDWGDWKGATNFSFKVTATSQMPSGGDPTALSWTVVNSRWVRNSYSGGYRTMSDRNTGLMWVYDASSRGGSDWQGAKDHCTDLIHSGHDDWFLPGKNRLADIYTQKSYFIDVQGAYWSSTEYSSLDAYYVDMSNGIVNNSRKFSVFWIWPCRVQGPGDEIPLTSSEILNSVRLDTASELADYNNNTLYDVDEDFNANGTPDAFEDLNGNGEPDSFEDFNDNGTPDAFEDFSDNGTPDAFEDFNGNGIPDAFEDFNGNSIADAFDDIDNNGMPDAFEFGTALYGLFRTVGVSDAVTNSIQNSGDGYNSWMFGGVGVLSDGEFSGISVSLTGLGVLSFDWKVSSEADWDILSFYEVGSGGTNSISGNIADWSHVSLAVSGGAATTHTFIWKYEKDPLGDYVGEDSGWVDAINWSPAYTLVVNNGSGDGVFTNASEITITADPPPQHQEFDRWTGDTNTVEDVLSSDTSITMTGTGLVVTATYKPILYPLVVNNGSGSGSYAYGSVVEIGADYMDGKHFYRWAGDVDTVANVMLPTTTVQTVDGTISVTATYIVPVTVNNGTGDGWYPEGSAATIKADPDPMYMEFSGWTGDSAGQLDDPFARTAQLTVPDGPASVTATYTTSISRVAGCYGRTFTQSGVTGGVSMDTGSGSPSGTPAVMLGGSGVVPDNGFAAFETVVWGSGSVTFWWKVSSESGADYLKFKVDGSEVESMSGTKVPWTQVSNRVDGAGMWHTLRWEYVKNESISSSTDAGWVDDIVWIGDVPNPVISPDIQSTTVIDDVLSFVFLGERGIPYYAYSNAVLNADGWIPMGFAPIELGETNGLFRFLFAITLPANQGSCFYNVVASPPEYSVTFVNWDATVLKIEHVMQGSSATAPAVDPTRQSDSIYLYTFTGWDLAFNNVQSELTVRAQYEATPLPEPVVMLIPAGTNSGTDPDYGAYRLTVDAFYMDVFEVTNDEMVWVMQWAYNNGKLTVSSSSVRNAQGSRQELLDLDDPDCRITWDGSSFGMKSAKGAGYPCVKVTWYGAAAYCNYRSEMYSLMPCYSLSDWSCNFSANGYRLPTRDEWEYAARGGLRGRRFPWGDTITHSQANYFSSSTYSYDVSSTSGYHPDYEYGGDLYTSPVGDFAPNGYGLYDMAGNVWEWCNDASGSVRCIRGGSWNYFAFSLRCGNKDWYSAATSRGNFGFRSVRR